MRWNNFSKNALRLAGIASPFLLFPNQVHASEVVFDSTGWQGTAVKICELREGNKNSFVGIANRHVAYAGGEFAVTINGQKQNSFPRVESIAPKTLEGFDIALLSNNKELQSSCLESHNFSGFAEFLRPFEPTNYFFETRVNEEYKNKFPDFNPNQKYYPKVDRIPVQISTTIVITNEGRILFLGAVSKEYGEQITQGISGSSGDLYKDSLDFLISQKISSKNRYIPVEARLLGLPSFVPYDQTVYVDLRNPKAKTLNSPLSFSTLDLMNRSGLNTNSIPIGNVPVTSEIIRLLNKHE
jgi:hypothetical protein